MICLSEKMVDLLTGMLRDVDRAATIECHTTNISDIAFNLSLNVFVTAGEDRTVKLWSLVSLYKFDLFNFLF